MKGDGYSGGGDGYGAGYGGGTGGISSIGGEKVFYIDGIPCVVDRIVGNLAIARVVQSDLTMEKAYICKDKERGLFAHGDSFEDARAALEMKIRDALSGDEKIGKFLSVIDKNKKYPGRVFYDWHHFLTGSCAYGRDRFVKGHGVDLDKDFFTVQEFCEMCKDNYGGAVIKKIAEVIASDKQRER